MVTIGYRSSGSHEMRMRTCKKCGKTQAKEVF
jgi:hypothetical protein